ncbi:MFS transporter [Amycolatopsis sp. CA-230715]|uniref:MFS transporter n=1 Tax=Amycolatopsis sp. CA-230715 TaxID=2745196 RepID=UPI001C32A5AE|nr:MFS transporter [Amycolatopsis sp. CA-230715]QWF78050.1 Putative multidrug resistance protein MdtD [Amycolatopsis sp. CA-230715]
MTAVRMRGGSQLRGRPWLTLVGGVLGGAMVGLDGTAITIAAPFISSSVDATLGDLELIANAYLVALAIGLLPAGKLADRIGRRRTFVIGVALFGLASLGVALSGGVAALVAFRVLQGFAGALLQPAALAMLRNAFPADKLGLPLGIWGGANALAIGLGPVLSGLVVQGFGWQAVFLLNVPVAVLTVALAFFAVVESKGDEGTGRGGLRRLLRDRSVTLGAALVGVSSVGVFALLFLLTLYLQNVRGMSPIEAGAWMLAPTCVVVVSAPIGGMLAQRFGPRWPVVAGLVLVAAGLVGMTTLDRGSVFTDLLAPGLLAGFGTGLCVIAATEAIMGGTPDELGGIASGLQQVASQLGGVLGIAVVGGVMSWRVSDALGRHSTEAGLPGPVAETVRAGTDAVTQGKIPDGFEPGTVGARLANAVSAVAKLSFVDAMGVAFLVIAAVSLLGAIAGVLIPKTAAPEPADDTPEPALTP